MKANGITVPDAGSSRQYIPDKVGGWMYIVTTDIGVEQVRIADFQQKFDEAKKVLADAQSAVDELQPQVDAISGV